MGEPGSREGRTKKERVARLLTNAVAEAVRLIRPPEVILPHVCHMCSMPRSSLAGTNPKAPYRGRFPTVSKKLLPESHSCSCQEQ